MLTQRGRGLKRLIEARTGIHRNGYVGSRTRTPAVPPRFRKKIQTEPLVDRTDHAWVELDFAKGVFVILHVLLQQGEQRLGLLWA